MSSAAADDHLARWYDLRQILAAGAYTEAGVDLRLHLSSSAIDNLEPDHFDVSFDDDSGLSLKVCVAAIRTAIGADEAASLTGIDQRAGLVLVTGNEAAQAAAARTVAALGAVAADSVIVELYRIDDALLPPSVEAVLDASQASELIGALKGAAAHRHSVRIGHGIGFGNETLTTYLFDYDAEVAQGALALDPVVTALRTGLHAGVRIDRASDGERFVVRIWGRDGELKTPLERVEIGALGGAPIELPEVATSMWTSSAIIPPGGAIVIDHDGGGRSALVLRVVEQEGSTAPSALIPLGELALRAQRPALPRLASAGPSGGWGRVGHEFADQLGTRNPKDSLRDLVKSAFKSTVDAGLMIPVGSALLMPAPEAIPAAALDAYEALRSALPVATIAVDVRYAFLPSTEAQAAVESGDLKALAERADGRLLGCGIESDALMLVGGVEYAYVMDYDMKIAAGAVVGDPILHRAFEGVAVWCAPRRGLDGGITAWFDVQAHAPAPRSRAIDTVSYHPRHGDGSKDAPEVTGTFNLDQRIQLPVTRRAAARTLVRANAGEWTLVMMQPLTGTDRSLVVLTRMTL